MLHSYSFFSNGGLEENMATFPLFLVLIMYHYFFASLCVLRTLTLYSRINRCHGEKLTRFKNLTIKIFLGLIHGWGSKRTQKNSMTFVGLHFANNIYLKQIWVPCCFALLVIMINFFCLDIIILL
jgi:hypothetical protein